MIKYKEAALIYLYDFLEWIIENKVEILNRCSSSRFKQLSSFRYHYWSDELEHLEGDEILSEDYDRGDGFFYLEKITIDDCEIKDEFDAIKKVLYELFYEINSELIDKNVLIFLPL